MPDALFPVASAGGGDQVCLNCDPADPKYGQVFLWLREGEADPDQDEIVGYDNVLDAAPDFVTLLADLHPTADG